MTFLLVVFIIRFITKLRFHKENSKPLEPEIAHKLIGFLEGKGTSNAMYILRTMSERALEMQNELYLCFIDYTKAFDSVKHKKLIKLIESLNVDGKT